MPYVFFQTFGCQMNVADSNEIGTMFFRSGYLPTEDPSQADVIIVNTCSVREHAEKRAKVRIGEYGRLKKKGAELWVVGCMAERLGGRLKKEITGVTKVIGARSFDRIESIVSSLNKNQHTDIQPITEKNDISDFVSIMRGCNNYCAYCIVPYVRGPEASIPVTEIIDSINRKVDKGVKEITLLGQNVNSYLDNGIDFPDLLHKVAEIDGLVRIRFTTSHPKDCSEKLIRTIAEEPKCCHHIHLPFQAGADRILALMNRNYSAAEYRDRITMIRSYLPAADITTDILVGFPSETDEEFEATMSLTRTIRFTTAFMFAYSLREGTAAAQMADTVSHEIKQQRLRRLIDLQTDITKEIYADIVEKNVTLLVGDRQQKRDRMFLARDNGCKRALIACNNVKAGTIFEARVVRTSGMTLICERTVP